jgi:predicted nucleic acid-binding protein
VLAYADTSALAKLILEEPEWPAVARFLGDVDVLITSRLTQVELVRAAARHPHQTDLSLATIMERLVFRELTPDLAAAAARLQPPELRSLDAIHLATALELMPDLDAFLTHDKRLADAARQHGLTVAAPA